MSYHSPIPRRPWHKAIPWLHWTGDEPLATDFSIDLPVRTPTPSLHCSDTYQAVLDFIQATELLPNQPFQPSCPSPTFSATSTLCLEPEPTLVDDENAEWEHQKLEDESGGDAQLRETSIRPEILAACKGTLHHRVLHHFFPPRTHSAITELLFQHTLDYYANHRAHNAIHSRTAYSQPPLAAPSSCAIVHRELAESISHFRNQTIRILRTYLTPSRRFPNQPHFHFLEENHRRSGPAKEAHRNHVVWLTCPNEYLFMSVIEAGVLQHCRNPAFSAAAIHIAKLTCQKCPTFAQELLLLQTIPFYFLRHVAVLLLFVLRHSVSEFDCNKFSEPFYKGSVDVALLEKHFDNIKTDSGLIHYSQMLFRRMSNKNKR